MGLGKLANWMPDISRNLTTRPPYRLKAGFSNNFRVLSTALAYDEVEIGPDTCDRPTYDEGLRDGPADGGVSPVEPLGQFGTGPIDPGDSQNGLANSGWLDLEGPSYLGVGTTSVTGSFHGDLPDDAECVNVQRVKVTFLNIPNEVM
jgi:hypothetical protein